MEQIIFNHPDTSRMIVFTDKAPEQFRGNKLPILKLSGFPDFYMRFDDKLDLDNMLIIRSADPEYKESDAPTLNDLVEAGIIEQWYPYRYIHFRDVLGDPRFSDGETPCYDAIVDYCTEQGLNVDRDALEKVFIYWAMGYKVGYRDEKNGVHLFAPSGRLNPFNLCVTELHPLCDDWQTTYIC